jgi:hypothetical protein
LRSQVDLVRLDQTGGGMPLLVTISRLVCVCRCVFAPYFSRFTSPSSSYETSSLSFALISGFFLRTYAAFHCPSLVLILFLSLTSLPLPYPHVLVVFPQHIHCIPRVARPSLCRPPSSEVGRPRGRQSLSPSDYLGISSRKLQSLFLSAFVSALPYSGELS